MNASEHPEMFPPPVAAPGGPHLNALKHGLRSRSILLPGDDVAEYRRMRQEMFDLYRPRTGNEARCVEAMANHEWAMERCRHWRAEYHAKLQALLYGNLDGTPASHCEGDPHRWHHSAMDCALEEGRLGRLLDRERRKLEALQKLRRQNLIADATEKSEPGPRVRAWESGDDDAAATDRLAAVASASVPVTPSEDEANGENPKRNLPAGMTRQTDDGGLRGRPNGGSTPSSSSGGSGEHRIFRRS